MKLNSFTKSWWFLQGLQLYKQTEELYQYKLDPHNDINMEFNNLFKKVMKLLGDQKKLTSIVHIEKKNLKAVIL